MLLPLGDSHCASLARSDGRTDNSFGHGGPLPRKAGRGTPQLPQLESLREGGELACQHNVGANANLMNFFFKKMQMQ
jgi:hypothetical protein